MKLFFTLATLGLFAGQAQSQDICLRQSDFDQGTKIIDTPGYYKLCENISFRPNYDGGATTLSDMETIFDPDFSVYSPNNYGLGFFAAIAVEAHGVTIDLNGFTLEQSVEHALMQRFFALIELANAPFIQSVGPAQFVGASESFSPASDFVLKGPGTMGRSSHHGVHGNENSNVHIHGVTFQDFEVAAVSLNKVTQLTINDCVVAKNRKDVPIVGLFSAARFIRPYVKKLTESGYTMEIGGTTTSADSVYNNLLTSIKNVFDDVSSNGSINPSSHPEEHQLFDNPKRVVDGPCYAFLVHGRGPAVAGFADTRSQDLDVLSKDVFIEDNDIREISCWNNEVPAALEDGKPVNDVRGAILQFFKTFGPQNQRDLAASPTNGGYLYKGNAVADAQIMVAKAVLDGVITASPEMQTVPNSINMNIVNWAMSSNDVYTPKFRCNGDSMHHVVKGITVVRVDDCLGFTVQNNHISNIENLSEQPFTDCFDYHTTSSENSDEPQQAGNVRVISAAASAGYIPGPDGKIAKMAGTPSPRSGAGTGSPSILPNWNFEDGSIEPWTPVWDWVQGTVEVAYDSELDSNVGRSVGRHPLNWWEGIGQDVTDLIDLNNEYMVKIKAKLVDIPAGYTDQFFLTLVVDYTDGHTDYFNTGIWTDGLDNQWQTLKGFFGPIATTGTVSKLSVVAEGVIEHSFAIDDLVILEDSVALTTSLLPNWDFESGSLQPWTANAAPWSEGTIELAYDSDLDSNVGRSVGRSQVNFWEGIGQDVTDIIEAGKQYIFQVKAKLVDVPDGVTDQFWMTLAVSYADGNTDYIGTGVWTGDLSNQWQSVKGFFGPFEPIGTVTSIELLAEGPQGHSFAIDDLILVEDGDVSTVPITPTNPTTPQECPVTTLDFSTLSNKDWLSDQLWGSDCVKVTAVTNERSNSARERGFTPVNGSHNPAGGAARVFDSEDRNNCDSDLMTPSPKFFNGPQKGCSNCCGGGPYLMDKPQGSNQCVLRDGKQTPNPFKNDLPRGNVLIIQEWQGGSDSSEMNSCPDDTYVGGYIKFEFCKPVSMKAIGLLDVDHSNSADIELYYSDGRAMKSIDVDATGDNGYWKYDFDETNVVEVRVKYRSSGAVESIDYSYCDTSASRALGEAEPSAVQSLRGGHHRRQLQAPAVDSIISFNEIYDIFSRPQGPCVGIDIQGTSEQMELTDNIVDLDENIRGNGSGRHVGIRFRSLVDEGKIKKERNTLPQGSRSEKAGGMGGQSVVITPGGHPDVTEWELGQSPGCPFANR